MATTDSVEQLVIDAIVAKLATITTANGYTRDIGPDRVLDYDAAPTQVPTPCLLLRVEETKTEADSFPRYQETLKLTVVFVDTLKGNTPGKEARGFKAEVLRALGDKLSVNTPITPPPNGTGGTRSIQVPIHRVASILNGGGLITNRVYGQVDLEVPFAVSRSDPALH